VNIKIRHTKITILRGVLNLKLHTCEAGALPLEPHLQSILLCLILEMGSHELFAQAGLESRSSHAQLPKYLGI
jgi:hypothetical protein